MKTLTLSPLQSVDTIVTPENLKQLTLKSSALEVFTDFKKQQPLIIDANTKATDANLLMKKAHVRLKLVISEENRFLGTISSEDITERQIVKRVAEGEDRENLLASDLMKSRESLQVLDFSEIVNASIEDLIHTLQSNGLGHCLVVDHSNHEIRGIISTSDIARRLHIEIDLTKAQTFASIFKAIHG